jgi:hypothetical protein
MKPSFSLLKAYRLILSASFVAGNIDPLSIFRQTGTKNSVIQEMARDP